MKRLSLSLVCLLAACGGSGGGSTTTPSPVSTPTPLPSNLTGRSVETDAVVGTSAVSGTEVTLTASGFLTLQTSLSLHTNGVAYLRPSTGEMSASAVAPFVFWNAERSVGWPATTTTMTYVLEASISGDAAAVAAVDSTVAKLNSLGMANVNGQRVTFARASSGGSGGVCSLRVDAADADIVRSNLPGWTRSARLEARERRPQEVDGERVARSVRREHEERPARRRRHPPRGAAAASRPRRRISGRPRRGSPPQKTAHVASRPAAAAPVNSRGSVAHRLAEAEQHALRALVDLGAGVVERVHREAAEHVEVGAEVGAREDVLSVARKSRRSTLRSVSSRNLVSESWPSPRMRKALCHRLAP
jgi:hypothetical protein